MSASVSSQSRPAEALCLHARLGTALLVFAAACATSPQVPVAPPAAPAETTAASTTNEEDAYRTAPAELRDTAPKDIPTAAWHFPSILDASLPNGLTTKLVKRAGVPVVDLRLVVLSGSASDGSASGVANLAGEMLKVGGTGAWSSRELLERVESLGASLDISTGRDSTTLHLAVTADQFEAALSLLSQVAQKPRFNAEEFDKLKRREVDRIESLARSSAAWVSSRVLYEKLYATSKSVKHPYSAFDSSSTELDKRTLAECKSWHKTHLSPKNSVLIVAGDVDEKRLAEATQREFGTWKGAKPKALAFPEVTREPGLRLFVVDRPKSAQAEVTVALWGPERKSPDFVPMAVTNQILGGGVSGRLFGDVREKRSLAYSTYSTFERLANGPSPLLLKAGTQTAKAGLTLDALLEHATRLSSPASDEEIKLAVRYQTDIFLLRAETAAGVSGMTTDLSVFGLGSDYYDRFREQVGTTSTAQVLDIGKRYYNLGTSTLVVIAGDAERLAAPLSHFADVQVLDADHGFTVKQVVPKNPAAPIELPRIGGT